MLADVFSATMDEHADIVACSEEEDPDDYPFPLTLRAPKKPSGPTSPVEGVINGTS